MVKDHTDNRRGNPLLPHGYYFRLAARILLYSSSHRQDNTHQNLCYTSCGALAGTRNSSMGPPDEGSIRRPIALWANALTTELHIAHKNRITHTTAFVTPVVEHWLEKKIDQWFHQMKDRSDDPSHHEQTLLQRSYISLLEVRTTGPQLSAYLNVFILYRVLRVVEIGLVGHASDPQGPVRHQDHSELELSNKLACNKNTTLHEKVNMCPILFYTGIYMRY